MFTLSAVLTLNTQLKLLHGPKTAGKLRLPVNGNFNLTPTVCVLIILCSLLFLKWLVATGEIQEWSP